MSREGYVYLIYTRRVRAISNRIIVENIYKIGKTTQHPFDRFGPSKVSLILYTSDRYKLESELISIFTDEFELVEGRKWFRGDVARMIPIMYNTKRKLCEYDKLYPKCSEEIQVDNIKSDNYFNLFEHYRTMKINTTIAPHYKIDYEEGFNLESAIEECISVDQVFYSLLVFKLRTEQKIRSVRGSCVRKISDLSSISADYLDYVEYKKKPNIIIEIMEESRIVISKVGTWSRLLIMGICSKFDIEEITTEINDERFCTLFYQIILYFGYAADFSDYSSNDYAEYEYVEDLPRTPTLTLYNKYFSYSHGCLHRRRDIPNTIREFISHNRYYLDYSENVLSRDKISSLTKILFSHYVDPTVYSIDNYIFTAVIDRFNTCECDEIDDNVACKICTRLAKYLVSKEYCTGRTDTRITCRNRINDYLRFGDNILTKLYERISLL